MVLNPLVGHNSLRCIGYDFNWLIYVINITCPIRNYWNLFSCTISLQVKVVSTDLLCATVLLLSLVR